MEEIIVRYAKTKSQIYYLFFELGDIQHPLFVLTETGAEQLIKNTQQAMAEWQEEKGE